MQNYRDQHKYQAAGFTDNYRTPERQQIKLFYKSQQQNWNSNAPNEWNMTPYLKTFPCRKQFEPLAGFSPFESLTESDQISACWQRHLIEISEILHGEQAALLLSAQLVSLLPTMAGKLFASSQVRDEARHVDFFRCYLQRCGADITPPSAPLRELIRQGTESDDWQSKLLICQVLIESLALSRFQEIRNTIEVPALSDGLGRILKDEARHVHFGSSVLARLHRDCSETTRNQRSAWVITQAIALSNSNLALQPLMERFSWNSAALRRHLREFYIKNPTLSQRRMAGIKQAMDAAGLDSTGV